MADEDSHRMFQDQAYCGNDPGYDPDKYRMSEPVNDSISISEIRRDLAAIVAMHAILTQPDGGDRPYDFVAQSAYRMADAMERARNSKSPLDVAMDQGSDT